MGKRTLLVLSLLAGLAPACEEPKEAGTKVQIQVSLPEPPKLPPLPFPAQYDGGIYSVVGLKRALILRRGPKVMETDQTVKGFVVAHYENPCKKNDKDCLGKQPHFFIADSMDSPSKMTVVPAWNAEGEKLLKLYPQGTQFDFKGRFTVQAGNGFADAAGLLNIDCPPEECPVEEVPTGPDPSGRPPRIPGR